MGFGPIGGTPVRFLKRLALRLVLAALVAAGAAATFVPLNAAPSPAAAGAPRPDGTPVRLDSDNAPAAARAGRAFVEARLQADVDTVRTFRPAYEFWQHIFAIPDGRILLGSATNGRLLATFPVQGDWNRDARWEDPTLSSLLAGRALPRRLSDRRDAVVRILEPTTGPLVHNPARGQRLITNAERYGAFLSEWGSIYERFGVPAEIGLSQAILESSLDGRARSRARALGFCQWLPTNWRQLNRLTSQELEAYNQTTQAPFCAAYLSILATMYGSFIPALSEHHSGGVNVGRVLINGERLGATDAREQYFIGGEFARRLRAISLMGYRDLYRSYGPRSVLYSEMVFGNTHTVSRLISEIPQRPVYAMRATRALPVSEVVRRSGLRTDEVKRYNPALVKQVPRNANVYLPAYVDTFGPDVSFWHRPPTAEYASALHDFLRLEPGVARWHEPEFEAVLRGFQRRFTETATEEGTVMGATLAFVIGDLRTSRRAAILEDFRTSGRILQLFTRGLREIRTELPGWNVLDLLPGAPAGP